MTREVIEGYAEIASKAWKDMPQDSKETITFEIASVVGLLINRRKLRKLGADKTTVRFLPLVINLLGSILFQQKRAIKIFQAQHEEAKVPATPPPGFKTSYGR